MTKRKHPKDKGLVALTTNPDTPKRKIKFTDNSLQNQRLKLLDYLLERGSITTSEAREKLDIYYPPARKFELCQAGYQIAMIWDNWTSDYGIKHRIARYVLTQKQPVDSDKDSMVAV